MCIRVRYSHVLYPKCAPFDANAGVGAGFSMTDDVTEAALLTSVATCDSAAVKSACARLSADLCLEPDGASATCDAIAQWLDALKRR